MMASTGAGDALQLPVPPPPPSLTSALDPGLADLDHDRFAERVNGQQAAHELAEAQQPVRQAAEVQVCQDADYLVGLEHWEFVCQDCKNGDVFVYKNVQPPQVRSCSKCESEGTMIQSGMED